MEIGPIQLMAVGFVDPKLDAKDQAISDGRSGATFFFGVLWI